MLVAVVVWLMCCPPLARAHDDNGLELGRAITQFAFDMYAELEGIESSVFSPLGLAALLGMLVEGTEGGTRQEIIHTLRLTDSHDVSQVSQHFHRLFTLLENEDAASMNFTVASRLSPQRELKLQAEYVRSLMQHYDASVQELDFANDPAGALRNINAWFSNHTNGLIQEALKQEPSAATILALMNAIYFKGAWAIPFPENETRLGKFHGVNSQTAAVAMMSLKDVALPYQSRPERGFTVVALPYSSNETCMLVVVPRPGGSLQHAMAAIREQGVEELLGQMQTINVHELQMPRFKVVIK
jgi:serine protease inhibitor